MPTNTIGNINGPINDFATLYQRFMGIPSYVSSEDLRHAVSVHFGDSDSAYNGWMGDKLRSMTGLTSHRDLLSGKQFQNWRDIRREVCGTLAILRSLTQAASISNDKNALYSGEMLVELDVLQRQFEYIKDNSICNGTLSAIYRLAASDLLMFRFEHGWSEGCLTALGLTHYQMSLDGSTYPLTYPEYMRGTVRRFDFELDGEYMHMARSAHAYAVKNLVEDVTDMALDIGSSDSPVRLVAHYNKRRETLDLETSGDGRLFKAIRENTEGKTDQLRQDHDGWWLEGDRIVIPISPLHYAGLLDDYSTEAWKRAARLLPFMKKLKDGGTLTREEYRKWESDLNWIVEHSKDYWRGRQESAEIGKITQLVRLANDQVSKEGRIVAVLGAKLKNWLQQHNFLAEAYSWTEKSKFSLEDFRRHLNTVYEAGFPSRVELLQHYFMAFSGNDAAVFNLDLEIGASNDVILSPMTQFAMHRVIDNVLLFAAQLAAGSDAPIQLTINYDGDRLNFLSSGALAGQLFTDERLQPGIIRSTLHWAKYASVDGKGLEPNDDMTEMSIRPDIAAASDLEKDYSPAIVVPVDRRPLSQYAHPAVKGGFLAFHPTSRHSP